MRTINPLISRTGLIHFCLTVSLTASVAAADVVAVVSINSPVTTLSKNQIAEIFLGKTARIPDGSLVVPINQDEDSTVHQEFYLKFTGKSPAQFRAHWSKIIFTGKGQPPRKVANSIEVKKYLLEHPDAIGYIEQDQVDDSVKVLLSL